MLQKELRFGVALLDGEDSKPSLARHLAITLKT